MGWETVIYLIIATVISIALAPKPPKPKAATLDDFDFPTAEEGRPIPVVFGTVRITGPNILWYGDLGTKAIKKKSLFSSTTVGYKYFMGLHFGICHGPVDALTKIEAGEKTAWSGNVTTNSSITVSQNDLFGGQKREGGLSGTVDVCMGGAAQTANTYLDSAIGYPLGGPAVLGDLPAFRGILGIVWRGNGSGGLFSFLRYDKGGYIGTTPYAKPWAFTVKRITSGWQGGTVWYSAKAAIGSAMNPAHIVYQTLTDPEWGMGLPADKLDEASFTTAADLLHAENFGLSLLWNQQATIEDFLSEVLNHVAGVLAFDRSSGKYRITLLRGNYDPGALPSYGPETLSSVTSFQRQAWGETTNELTLEYTDPTTLKSTSVTVHDLANVRAQGVRVATGLKYPGIVSATIAQEVAMRELAARSTPLAKVAFRVNRDLWQTKNADVVKINWPVLGIENLIVRVLKVRQGTLGNGELEIEGVEDVFALSLSTYTSQPSPDAGDTDPGLDEVQEASGPAVISATTTAPPGSPADGDSYLVPTGATGAWAGHDGEVAIWDADADAWVFETPAPGTVVTVTSTGSQVQTVSGGTAASYTPIQSTGKVVFGTSITPPALAADTNDYAPANLATASGMRLSASGAARNLTGLTGGEGGRLMLVHNVGSLDLVLKDESVSSTAANRFALNADVTLKADQSTLLQYDGTSSRWRVIGGTGSGGSASPTTTLGDLIRRGASVDERLPIGPEGHVLTVSGGVPVWEPTQAGVTYLTTLLMHFDGVNTSTTFTDEIGHTFTAQGNAQLSTAQKKFGTASLALDGTGDCATTTYNAGEFRWWDEDFTIECFVYLNALPGSATMSPLVGNADIGASSSYWTFGPVSDGRLCFFYWVGATRNVYTTATIGTGAWHHIAMTHTVSGGIRLWVNGVGTTATAISGSPQDSAAVPFNIGHCFGSGLNGYVDDLRIVKGQSLYNNNFTPPVAPLENVQGGASASPTTTKGDLIVRGATADERLPVGVPGQWLTPDPAASGGVKWGTVAPTGAPNDGCAVRRTGSAQAIPNATYTAIQFDTETRDDSGYWAAGQPSRLTAPKAGWYAVGASIIWDSTGGGSFRILRVSVNGNANAHATSRVPASGNAQQSVTENLYLNAGDYVEFLCYIDTAGASLYTPSDGNYPCGWIHRLGTTVDLGSTGGAEITSAATQSIGHNVLPKTALTFDTVVRDDAGFANLGTNNSRLTIQSAGWYIVTGTVQWGAGGNGAYRVLEIWKNGSTAFLSNDSKPPATFAFMANVVAATHYFNAGDYVELRVYHDAGVSVSTSAGSARLALMRISAGPRRIIRGAQFVAANGLLSTSVNAVAVHCPRAATIRGVKMLVGENAGSVVVDIKKTTFASWGSGPGSSICASAKPTIVVGRTYSDDTLTGWTTAVAADDVLTFSLDSVSNLDAVSVQLTLDESQA